MSRYALRLPGRRVGRLHVLVACAILSLVLTAYLMEVSSSKPEVQRRERTLVSFQQKGVFDYDAVLKKNTLYESETLERGEGIFFTSIVDVLRIRYQYSLESKGVSSATARHSLGAFLVSRGSGKGSQVMWQKRLPLSDTSKVKLDSGSRSFTREYSLNVTEVLNLARTIEREINVRGDVYIMLSSLVYLEAESEASILEDKLSQEMMISLGSSIESEGATANSTKKIVDYIEEPGKVSLFGVTSSVSAAKHLSWGMFMITMLLSSLSTLYFFKNREKKNPLTSVEVINKKYGSWIVKADSFEPKLDGAVKIGSMKDMVRLSEELGRPIIYSKRGGSHIYSQTDGNTAYYFEVKE